MCESEIDDAYIVARSPDNFSTRQRDGIKIFVDAILFAYDYIIEGYVRRDNITHDAGKVD